MKNRCIYIAVVMLLWLPDMVCHGGVIVFDDVTSLSHPIFVKVLTKDKLFTQGGQLVTVKIGQLVAQTILTGGDGYGFLKFTPQQAGDVLVEATYNNESATAKILVMAPTDQALVTAIEFGLRKDPFAAEPRQHSHDVLKRLAQKYKLIYLYGFFGRGFAQNWLKINRFPEAILLKNQGKAKIKQLHERGVQMVALIGSADLASSSAAYVKKVITFSEAEDVNVVEDWQEIEKIIDQ